LSVTADQPLAGTADHACVPCALLHTLPDNRQCPTVNPTGTSADPLAH